MYGSQIWPLWNDSVKNICVQWRNALRKIWNLPRQSHSDLIPLIADCVPLDLALVFRFLKFYRTVVQSKNVVIKSIAESMTFEYRSTMGQNVRYIMSKYRLQLNDILNRPLNVLKATCKDKWLSNIHEEYMNYSCVIRDMVLMKDGNLLSFFTRKIGRASCRERV